MRVAPKNDHVIRQQDYDDNTPAAAYASTKYSRTPLIRKLVIRIGLGASGNLVENSTKLTCLEITGYRIQLWLLEHQIRRRRKV